MKLKRIVFWGHLVAGLTAGIILLALCVSGALLTFERQMVESARQDFASERSSSPPASAEAVLQAARAHYGQDATISLEFQNRDNAIILARKGRSDVVLVDPNSGQVVREDPLPIERVFGSIETFHRWLLFAGPSRSIGAGITGYSNLVFFFLIISGVYIWLPRVWRWPVLRNILLFRRHYPSAKARDYNWHHVLGAWLLIPLLAMCVTGIVISFDWAKSIAFGADTSTRSAITAPMPASGSDQDTLADSDLSGLDALLLDASSDVRNWTRLTARIAAMDSPEPISITMDRGTGGQPQLRSTIRYNPMTGARLDSTAWADRPSRDRRRAFNRFLHTGEVYGLPGQIIAGVASLGMILIIWTGFALAWRRLIMPRLGSARTGPNSD